MWLLLLVLDSSLEWWSLALINMQLVIFAYFEFVAAFAGDFGGRVIDALGAFGRATKTLRQLRGKQSSDIYLLMRV